MSGNIDAKIAFDNSYSYTDMLKSECTASQIRHENFQNAKDTLNKEFSKVLKKTYDKILKNATTDAKIVTDQDIYEKDQQIAHDQLVDEQQKSHTNILAEAILDAKKKKQALENAKNTLEEAFAPKVSEKINDSHTPILKTDEGITNDDINTIISEIKHEEDIIHTPTSSFEKGMSEKMDLNSTKRMIKNFREKVTNYPKHLSYDGSVILCVCLSMKNPSADYEIVNITKLPKEDQTTILEAIGHKVKVISNSFMVKFDDLKDFILTFNYDAEDKIEIVMFNAILHTKSEGNKMISDVPVEDDGDKVSIGNFILNKKDLEKIGGVPSKKDIPEKEQQDVTTRVPRYVNKNAYEIRETILEYAINTVKSSNSSNIGNIDSTVDKILKVAYKFYDFVENKRR